MSPNLLLVDMGNSRLKWARWHGASILQGGAFPSALTTLPDFLDRYWLEVRRPDEMFVANVAGPAAASMVQAWVDSHWRVPVRFAHSEAFGHGVINGYTQPERLGVDRWLALLGARREQATPLCVVDCGTALTLDLLDGQGRHQGGLIAPGLTTMMESLCQATQGIRMQDSSVQPPWPGRDTASCVEAGAMLACSGLIEKCVREWGRRQGDTITVVLTGGDAIRIGNELTLPWRLDEFLVMRGLLTWAENQT